ncbi:hypothetical protein GYMLUDRAFT_99761 [Collybiopsis luxurians FD-317 M1]|uniref:Uncharacterized protein n=1 Tax=Collybiopsis luxurians FD-317 M1 TaxID=944289 RepID=A0A0D0AWU1_9AGAR|nr:hypothetical protein GYMLUDRAFT_99761 [Collybiopsis luxurians FD-317 M1]
MHNAFLVSFSFSDLWNAQPGRVNLVLETTEIILSRVEGSCSELCLPCATCWTCTVTRISFSGWNLYASHFA